MMTIIQHTAMITYSVVASDVPGVFGLSVKQEQVYEISAVLVSSFYNGVNGTSRLMVLAHFCKTEFVIAKSQTRPTSVVILQSL